ncbi:MAG: GTPase [Candidatus Woesearchaeota archaeon]
MANYWNLVNKVIDESDLLLLILDSRMPELTRHKEIELKIKQKNKKLLYVLNKCDLITKEQAEEIKKNFKPSVFVSSTKKLGGTILYKKIMELVKGKESVIGILGYPNVGKSSVINLLKGQKSASVSPVSGHTKGIQFVKRGKLKLIDTPGVLPFDEKDPEKSIEKQVIIGSKNPEHLKEPEYFAMRLIDLQPKLFEKYYNLTYENDSYTFLEKIAISKKILLKGNTPDLKRMARSLLYDWQRGKIHEFFLKNNQQKNINKFNY